MFRKILYIALLVLPFTTEAGILHISLKKAIAKKMVSVKATSKGGFIGRNIRIQLFNNTPFALNIQVDPGLIFKPVDTAYQNLVVVGDEEIKLAPKDTASLALEAFCGKSHALSPREGLDYKFWKQGDSAIIKVVQFIKKHELYNYTGQHAVWVLTNNHSPGSVYDQSEISKQLAAYVANLVKKRIPKYYTKNRITETSGEVPYDPEVEKYYVEVLWDHTSVRNMHVYVLKEDGTLLWEENKDSISSKGHKAIVELDPQKLSKGTYYVKLQDDDNYIWQETEVIIE